MCSPGMAISEITDEMLNDPEYLQALQRRIELCNQTVNTGIQKHFHLIATREGEEEYPDYSPVRSKEGLYTPPRESPQAGSSWPD